MLNEPLLYQLAITLIPGIGDVNGKNLVAYCGSPEAVFNEKKSALMKIPGIG
ncbi:MAG TPA: DNA-protecting protein DprA, partial [Bacteroidetes bacterium]|nr:DNA-protecting protein DprA [Bacteroidota bacterium]